MKLRFLFYPVSNAVAAARFYREQFGWEELWRESDMTICIGLPGADVSLLLDQNDDELPAGGFFDVPNVDEFYRERKDTVNFVVEPKDIPPGRYAIFMDPAGNTVRIFDNSKDS